MIAQFLVSALLLYSPVTMQTANPLFYPGLQQQESPGYYIAPLDGNLLLSANFAEVRTNHLHSGIDIKTGGVVGKPVYAVADGYISRIGVIPGGFGRVLYVTHPNGTTTVYGHLDRFMPEVETYVTSERYRLQKHRIDLFPDRGRFPVKQGEQIAFSGNSGISFGPHLHFEVRNTALQRPLNLLAKNMLSVRDDIPPIIQRLYYIGLDTIQGVPVYAAPEPIEVRKVSEGVYVPRDNAAFPVGRQGYFVLETTDRKNGTANTMGVYRVTSSLDGRASFDFSLDGFLFSETRYVNSLTEYPLQLGARNELIRLAVQAGNRLPVFGMVSNRGVIAPGDSEIHTLELRVEDDACNVSTLSLRIRKDTLARPFVLATDTAGIRVNHLRAFTHSADGLTVTIPARALYEPIFLRSVVMEMGQTSGGKRRYSPVYEIHSPKVPLHQSMTISIEPESVPDNLLGRLCLASVSGDGRRYAYAGGRYEAGRVTGQVRAFGNYCVVADDTPPTVKALFQPGADLRGKASVTFSLSDDFSGVVSFSGKIDGKWILFEQDVLRKTITHVFDPSRFDYSGRQHTLTLTVTDGAGNSTTYETQFVR